MTRRPADDVVDRLLDGLPRPDGPLRKLEGDEARAAFEAAPAANRALHAAHRELDGGEHDRDHARRGRRVGVEEDQNRATASWVRRMRPPSGRRRP